MLRVGGTATVVGMIPVSQKVCLPGHAFLDEKRIQGSGMGSNRFPVDMPRLVDFYLAGKLKLDELISQRIRLPQINEGFEALKTGELARSVSSEFVPTLAQHDAHLELRLPARSSPFTGAPKRR